MLKNILVICHALELGAETAYRAFSNQTDTGGHRSFWLEMAQDEKRHATYWAQLIELEEKGSLQNPLDHPEKILNELNAMKVKIDQMVDGERRLSGFSDLILWAFQIESYMLHPVFAIFFHFLRVEAGDLSPADDYQAHIEKFAQAAKKHLGHKPELGLIGEILSRMWERNRELVSYFGQIKTLRGLIPICASCKQVRNDQGYWERIEAYLERFSEAEFTHGICPECIKKLYPAYSPKASEG